MFACKISRFNKKKKKKAKRNDKNILNSLIWKMKGHLSHLYIWGHRSLLYVTLAGFTPVFYSVSVMHWLRSFHAFRSHLLTVNLLEFLKEFRLIPGRFFCTSCAPDPDDHYEMEVSECSIAFAKLQQHFESYFML